MKFLNSIFDIFGALYDGIFCLNSYDFLPDFDDGLTDNELFPQNDLPWRFTNPATGLPMMCGGDIGVDIAGNAYGSSAHDDHWFMSTTHSGFGDNF